MAIANAKLDWGEQDPRQENWRQDMLAAVNANNLRSRKYQAHEPAPFMSVCLDPEEEIQEDGYVDAEYEEAWEKERKVDIWGILLRLALGATIMTFVLLDAAEPILGTGAAAACAVWAAVYGIRGWRK